MSKVHCLVLAGPENMRRILAVVVLLLLGGCAGNGLVRDLGAQGVEPRSTVRLVFAGSEADFGSDVRVNVVDRQVISEVWHSIQKAKPTGLWCACGYRKVEFHTSPKSLKPAATLMVNATGASHVLESKRYRYDRTQMKMVGMFECSGLHDLIMNALKKEYARTHGQQRASN